MWDMQPSEFWSLSPWEFWLEFDRRAEDARARRRATVGGKSVPLNALEEAQATARRLHKAKKQAKAQEAAE